MSISFNVAVEYCFLVEIMVLADITKLSQFHQQTHSIL